MQYITINYILFLIKIITLILVLMIPLILIFFFKKQETHYIKITNLNKKYIKLRKFFYLEIYNKNLNKKLIKNLNTESKKIIAEKKKNIFIIEFNGDINASDTSKLKEIISLLNIEKIHVDEILLKLTSSGGLVNNYGLAAANLKRLKEKKIKLTIAVDLIAASGGYMMASVANTIIASPFAIIGSIGVIGIVPNLNKLLTNKNIEIEYHTAGEYKSTLSVIGKNSEEGRAKFIKSLENTHKLFKDFIKENRPHVDINTIATGEYWYGYDALNLNLIDKIQTSDEYIMEKLADSNIYEISFNEQKSIKTRIIDNIKKNILGKLFI